jgi:hypothetical protein
VATAAEVRALVRGRAAVDSGDLGLTDTTLNGFINSAARTIGLDGDWPWNAATESLVTVAGTATVAPGATWVGTKSLTIAADGEELEYVSIEDVDQSPSADRGRPSAYTIWGDTLVLTPTPDAVYTLTHRFYNLETSTLSGTDALDAKESFLEGIIEYATYLSLRHLKRIEEARMALEAYLLWLKRAKDNRLRRRGPYRVRVRPGSAV